MRFKKMAVATLVFSAMLVGVSVSASEETLGSDFSQVVNVNNSGTYSEPIYLQVLRNAKEFNVASEFESAYGKTASTSRSTSIFKNRTDYGFKVNGQFYYDEGISLMDNGTYHIEGYNCEMNSKGIIIPTSKIESEDFTIKLDVGKEVKLNKDTFYFQNYDFSSELVNAVVNSFDENATLTTASTNKLINAYDSYTKNANYHTTVDINISESTKTYTVYLNSFNDTETKNLDISELTKDIEPIVINVAKYQKYLDMSIDEIPDIKSELVLDLDVPEPHVLEVDITSIPKLINNSKDVLSDVRYITYRIYDKTFKKTYNFSREYYTFNSNKFLDSDKPVIEFNSDIKINLNSEVTFDAVFKNVYDSVFGKKSFSNISKLTYDFSNVNTSKTGTYKITAQATDYKGNIGSYSTTVEVVSDNAPIILQKYNKIYINKKTRIYRDLFKVIDDADEEASMTIDSKIVETSAYGGYLDITATDSNGHTTNSKIEFTWEKELNFYEKFVEYPLYKLKNLVSQIFE